MISRRKFKPPIIQTNCCKAYTPSTWFLLSKVIALLRTYHTIYVTKDLPNHPSTFGTLLHFQCSKHVQYFLRTAYSL
ncbi:hypothetical protein AQUCO_00300410v1 [Aquilegia coerulea]|uniref:Uncharacterized protein n=1 Tax=Aquilegia coerulea TaxID=218851 RepID=A0A2G5EYS0_AQUCA|nr:hypothetical protein AQUCO_00300410v1 [Aquilegia coerulea]